ncbi:methionine--tRNA ligase [Algiphilus sp.]|uniref:methionine--tRNA ligase n=1 Tax=Algiphilus sp. TaxID=1872431 RepID=UPI0025C69CFD|nr:methionine--tRNA ligase [Algiphilus sp.]MCK5768937.1 methionine--tRNA ligase [Algiphilus sp.]
MAPAQREIFVTNALPYANGPIHVGHLVGYVQADIWVRFQRSRGHRVHYVCADDAHGTPIMLAAEKAGVSPEAFIKEMQAEHEADFTAFGVAFDHYHSTHSDENRTLSTRIYAALRDAGLIETRTIEQAFDPQKHMFLPDRYVRGTCPRCGTADQYGDNCEACGATYTPEELRNPTSAVSGATPEWRPSEHYFFRLAAMQQAIARWMDAPETHLQPAVRAKLGEWMNEELRAWDISRDAPYFGFEIPDAPGKYFYVWLDAPIGYFASLQALCARRGDDLERFIRADSPVEMWHFIGKDIVNFHGLFWPAMLEGAGMRTPTALNVNGYLTVNGAKMSKSRGTFIRAATWRRHVEPELLRYYFAAKLSDSVEDLDLNLEDFVARVNSDLVGKYVNIAARCSGFIQKRFDGRLATDMHDPALIARLRAEAGTIAECFEARNTSAAVRRIMALADEVNEAIQQIAPWQIAKQEGREALLHASCTTFLNAFRLLTIFLAPIVPALAARARAFLGDEIGGWDAIDRDLLDHTIQPYTPLLTRVDSPTISAMTDDARADLEATPAPAATPQKGEPQAETIDIKDFGKVDLRIARIVRAEAVEGADKLLRLTLDVGVLGERQILAGIKAAYAPEDLEGRLTVVVANLAPRKMRFGVSEGMVAAASFGDGKPFLLSPDSGAEPGMRLA